MCVHLPLPLSKVLLPSSAAVISLLPFHFLLLLLLFLHPTTASDPRSAGLTYLIWLLISPLLSPSSPFPFFSSYTLIQTSLRLLPPIIPPPALTVTPQGDFVADTGFQQGGKTNQHLLDHHQRRDIRPGLIQHLRPAAALSFCAVAKYRPAPCPALRTTARRATAATTRAPALLTTTPWRLAMRIPTTQASPSPRDSPA